MDLKDRIIEVTTELFLEHGIKSVTMDIIAETMGISKRTLYQIFSDKNQLVGECISYMTNQAEEQAKKISKKTSIIERLVEHYIQSKNDSKKWNKNFMSDLRKFHPEIFQRTKARRDTIFRDYMVPELDKGIIDGYIRSDLNTEIMVILLREQFDIIERELPELSVFPVSEVIKTVFISFIRGISTSEGLKLIDNIMADKVGKRL